MALNGEAKLRAYASLLQACMTRRLHFFLQAALQYSNTDHQVQNPKTRAAHAYVSNMGGRQWMKCVQKLRG